MIGGQIHIRLTKDLVEVYFKGSRMTFHKKLEKYSVQPFIKTEHMPKNRQEYLTYNDNEFNAWAKIVGRSTEEIVKFYCQNHSDILPLNNLMNEWYYCDISGKQRAVIQMKGNNGKRLTTRAIYGYKKSPEDKSERIIDKPAAEIIRRIFALFLAESRGARHRKNA